MSSHPIEQIAREAFGFTALRAGQREAIESVLAGRDTLVVMSPGSGKSAIYAIASRIASRVTVVVAPSVPSDCDVPGCLCVEPDDLANASVLERVRGAGPELIVIEEAEHVCELDSAFRPDYLRLGAFIADMAHPPVLALTDATSPAVHEQIREHLHLHDPVLVSP